MGQVMALAYPKPRVIHSFIHPSHLQEECAFAPSLPGSMNSAQFERKLARIFSDITDNESTDADPEIMAMHVSKLCRFVTLIGGRDVPEIREELDRFSQLLPFYSMLETLRVTMRRLLADNGQLDPHLLGPLTSRGAKESNLSSLQSLHVSYTVHPAPPHDPSVLAELFARTQSIITEHMITRPVNVLLLLDYAVKRGIEMGLDRIRHDDDDDGTSADNERELFRFFQSMADDEDETPTPPKPGDPNPSATEASTPGNHSPGSPLSDTPNSPAKPTPDTNDEDPD
jgi:hypothetical protein